MLFGYSLRLRRNTEPGVNMETEIV